MKSRTFFIAVAAAVSLLPVQPRTAGLPAISGVGRAALSDFLRASDAPAAVALVVNRDGVIFEAAAGKRDVAANSPLSTDAIFRIASMTKPITSLAAMMLRDEGQVRPRRSRHEVPAAVRGRPRDDRVQ